MNPFSRYPAPLNSHKSYEYEDMDSEKLQVFLYQSQFPELLFENQPNIDQKHEMTGQLTNPDNFLENHDIINNINRNYPIPNPEKKLISLNNCHFIENPEIIDPHNSFLSYQNIINQHKISNINILNNHNSFLEEDIIKKNPNHSNFLENEEIIAGGPSDQDQFLEIVALQNLKAFADQSLSTASSIISSQNTIKSEVKSMNSSKKEEKKKLKKKKKNKRTKGVFFIYSMD